ncbi:MAG: polysaccharide biosynthesis tyrosine autokinase [Gaiellaceae bacterium]
MSTSNWSTTVDATEAEGIGAGLRHYIDVLRRRKWILVSVFVIAVAGAALFSAVQRSTYRAQSKLVIGQGGGFVPLEFGNQIGPYVATMADLLHSRVVAERVIRNLDLEESPQSVLSKSSVSWKPETAVLNLSYDDRSPAVAREVNRQLGVVFQALVKARFGRGTPARDGQPGIPALEVTIFDPAHVLPRKVKPRPVRNVAVAAALGVLLGLLAAFMRDYFDRGLRTREMVEQSYGVPVIGQIPFVRLGRRDQRIVFWEGFSDVAEAFRALRANLQYLGVKRPIRTILVTSAAPKQGKTTVTANLAVAIARSGATTIVLEGDLRRPRLDNAFEIGSGGPGLTSVLVGAVDIDEAIVDIPLPSSSTPAAREREGRLSFLPSGPLPPNPSELLSSLQMSELLDRLSLSFDYVLIDSPPVLPVADAIELARLVDGVVIVVRRNQSTRDEARELRALVERLGINLLGVVFTDVSPAGGYGGYGTYGDTPPAEERPAREPELVAHEEF